MKKCLSARSTIKKTTDKNEIEGEEGVNAYKGIFFIFAYEICGHMDKRSIAFSN